MPTLGIIINGFAYIIKIKKGLLGNSTIGYNKRGAMEVSTCEGVGRVGCGSCIRVI